MIVDRDKVFLRLGTLEHRNHSLKTCSLGRKLFMRMIVRLKGIELVGTPWCPTKLRLARNQMRFANLR